MARPGATPVNQADGSAVGDVRSSMLSLAQFQAQNGTNWVLADGASAAGTKYNTITGNANLPDMRGMALRGKNNGRSDGNQNPDGDSALGTFQSDHLFSHTHVQNAHNHNGLWSTAAPIGSGAGTWSANGPYSQQVAGSNPVIQNTTASNQNNGGNESRMRNVTVNHFIKVN